MLEREPISVVTVAKPSVGVHISFNTTEFMLKRGLTSVSCAGSVSADPHTSLNIINSILKRNLMSAIITENLQSENILNIFGSILERDRVL